MCFNKLSFSLSSTEQPRITTVFQDGWGVKHSDPPPETLPTSILMQ